jgi:hypothetical protein
MPALTYALLGPPLGAISFWVFTLLPGALLNFESTAWSGLFKLLFVFVIYSYALGGVPAIATGFGHMLVRNRLPTVLKRIVAMVGLGGALQTLFLLVGTGSRFVLGNLENTASLIAAAAVSAGLVSWAIESIHAWRLSSSPHA